MDSFVPSLLAQSITGLFAIATLLTGAAALFANKGWSLLVRTEDLKTVSSEEIVTAPNVRGWGVRQIVTGICLWAALILGDQVLFQVGLLSVLIRQGLDTLLYLLDGTPRRTILFIVAAIPTAAAFMSVL